MAELIPAPRFDDVYWEGARHMADQEDIWAEYNKITEDERIALESIETWQKVLVAIRREKQVAHEKALASLGREIARQSRGAV
jgi:hypothetical protein